MTSAQTGNGLRARLETFRERVNGHRGLGSILKGWNPVFNIECRDSGAAYTFRVREGKVQDIADGVEEDGAPVGLVGDEGLLERLFSGELNPVQAHSNGDLALFGEAKDLVKLDAVVLVLWDQD